VDVNRKEGEREERGEEVRGLSTQQPLARGGVPARPPWHTVRPRRHSRVHLVSCDTRYDSNDAMTQSNDD
jgi:hypothetical protein